MKCSNCGKTIPKTAGFCAYCGTTAPKGLNWRLAVLAVPVGLALCIGFLGILLAARALFSSSTPTITRTAYGSTTLAPTNPPTSAPIATFVPTADARATAAAAQQTDVSAQQTTDSISAQQTAVSVQRTSAAIADQQAAISAQQTSAAIAAQQSAVSAQQTSAALAAQQAAIDAQQTSAAIAAQQTALAQPTPTPAVTTFHSLANKRHPSLCLGVKGDQQADGSFIAQLSCSGGANQTWGYQDMGSGFYQLVVQSSAKCMTVQNGSTDDWALVIQAGCTGADYQQWKLQPDRGYFRIVVKNSGKCIDEDRFSGQDGLEMQIGPCNYPDNDNQLWQQK